MLRRPKVWALTTIRPGDGPPKGESADESPAVLADGGQVIRERGQVIRERLRRRNPGCSGGSAAKRCGAVRAGSGGSSWIDSSWPPDTFVDDRRPGAGARLMLLGRVQFTALEGGYGPVHHPVTV